jgi:hypothetical protein
LAHPQGFKLLKTNFKDEEDMVLELHRNLELFFQKDFEGNYLSSSEVERAFVALQCGCPMSQKSLNLIKEW